MRRYLDNREMDDVVIERLRTFEPEALEMHPDGFCVMHSGGKDSVTVDHLVKRAGVKHTLEHNHTTCDPTELVYFVRSIKGIIINKPPMSMWALIRKEGMLPLRQMRFCCRALKERGGTGRLVVTGVRWGESGRRSKRQMVEACYRDKTKKYLHPIIDWPTDAVWEYIREREVPYCKLYDPPYNRKRVGCVLCPMTRDIARQMELWPRLCKAWERAGMATFGPDSPGETPEEYWQWWLDRDAPSRKATDDPVLFEDNPELTEAT